jgi:hypothetical protein
MNSNIISLPISIGEALDKLTILEIKKKYIQDHRRKDVEVEYNMLYEKLKDYISINPYLYQYLLKINDIIWKNMDRIRADNNTKEEYMKLCNVTILENDIRFRIKSKMNIVMNSFLKEQKGYKENKIEIFIQEIPTCISPQVFCDMIFYKSIQNEKCIIYLNENIELKDLLLNLFRNDHTVEIHTYSLFNKENENHTIYLEEINNIHLLCEKMKITDEEYKTYIL